jgi:hypothetical protein
MAGIRCTALQSRPTEFLDCTSVTLEEFQQLVPPFETVFHARMAAWRMDGKPRTARRFTVYKHCPLPTPEKSALLPPLSGGARGRESGVREGGEGAPRQRRRSGLPEVRYFLGTFVPSFRLPLDELE